MAAINAGDATRLTELAAPNVDYMPYLAALTGAAGAYHGYDGLWQYVRDLSDVWSEYEVEIYFQDLGDHVLMKGRLRGKGKSSGLDIDAEMAWLHTFREGAALGVTGVSATSPARPKPLEAAGLSE